MHHDKIKFPQVLGFDVLQLRDDISQLERTLGALKEKLRASEEPGPAAPAMEAGATRIDCQVIRSIIRARRIREQRLGSDLFADPAWDILLEAFAAQLEQRRLSVSSLCAVSSVPATTAMRWIKRLEQERWLDRKADPFDGRRFWLELTPEATGKIRSYFEAVLGASLPI